MTASNQPKTVLITGCSEGGIGDALAQEFHRRGLRVFASARNLDKIKHLKEAGIQVLRLDVQDKTSIEAAVEELSEATGGTLDILVNNSGVGYMMPLLDADIDEARKLFDVNIWGTLAVTQACAPLLRATADRDLPARIVNIGSVTSRMQVPWQGVYNASKAALHMLNDTMRIEFASLNIEVLHVVTGGIATKFFNNASGAVLPEDSAYAEARDVIESDVAGHAGIKSQTMSPEKYAEIVVSNTLSRWPTKSLWVGGRANLSWLGDRFLTPAISDWIISNYMGWSMGALKKRLRELRTKGQGK
ncbi:putative short-chain dehydrogenase/reductase [Xylariaceae sp. FL0255]|nr:putative short-chain dehydrogenase/reductase [Xylariaceae sp. FL0255]